jgi:UDP-N-acetylmuramoylalanine--D-glutamate ligase
VTVVDAAAGEPQAERAARLRAEGIEVLLGSGEVPSGRFDACIASPGIRADGPWLGEVRRRGIPVWPEFELGWSRCARPAIAVTGTNGKSTMVKWIAGALGAAGRRAVPCGNYGRPVCEVALDAAPPDWLVIEASSFQLELATVFRAEVAILLNLLPNHLDRHPDFAAYEAAKARLFAAARAQDCCVVPAGLRDRLRGLAGGAGRWVTFGAAEPADYVYRAGQVWRAGAPAADLRGTGFANDVLGLNAAGAVAGLEGGGVPADAIRMAAEGFVPLPHRMQTIAELGGVVFVNDSKATTLSAMSAALRMTPHRAHLIAGGLLKENGLAEIKKVLADKAAGVYLIGRASEKMRTAWSATVPCFLCSTLDVALGLAWRNARRGEWILLSPGCASFDQFRGYDERGAIFGDLVRQMVEKQRSAQEASP